MYERDVIGGTMRLVPPRRYSGWALRRILWPRSGLYHHAVAVGLSLAVTLQQVHEVSTACGGRRVKRRRRAM
jgi:hypothetical protein